MADLCSSRLAPLGTLLGITPPFHPVGRRRGRSYAADPLHRRVPTVRAPATRVQVLVQRHEGHQHRLLLHRLPAVQRARLLADPRHVLHHALLHHDEAADQGTLCGGWFDKWADSVLTVTLFVFILRS